MFRNRTVLALLLLLTLFTLGMVVGAQDDLPDAEIENDEGGVQLITGELIVTNPNVKTIYEEPFILLEDLAGYVTRDIDFEIPLSSQVIGAFTEDFFTEESISYRLALPVVGGGTLLDVDNDGEEDSGLQIFQLALWRNAYGNTFIERLEGTGWSPGYSSGIFSEDPRKYLEIEGGNLLVYAPDDQQGFPSGFGADGLLFTEDDPAVRLPQGWTAVNLDSEPFTFDRSNEVNFTLPEPESLELNDFSDMSYADAFRALVEVFREEYSFTEYKNVDWDAILDEFIPRLEAADANNDQDEYIRVLRDFTWAIPDGHLQVLTNNPVLTRDFQERVAGGYGFALIELDDGRVIAHYLVEDSPAAEAGLELGAEITAWNGVPISDALAQVQPYGTFSNPVSLRYQQARYITRAPLGTFAKVTFINPGSDEAQTVTLETVEENESFAYTSVNRGRVFTAPPVEYRFLDNGYAYVKVNTFAGNETLIVESWEYFLNQVRSEGAPGIIIDLRQNGGGFTFIATRLASYFFNDEIDILYSEEYSPFTGEFFRSPFPTTIQPPAEEKRYLGPIAVLVGPACSSACEFFAYHFTIEDRAAIVGQYPTNGLGGGWFPTLMPDGVQMAVPTSRRVNPDGEIVIEGPGVLPTVDVPVDDETVFYEGDIVLDSAVEYLQDQATNFEFEDGGDIELGDPVEGELSEGQRVRYAFAGVGRDIQAVDIVVESDAAFIIRIYDEEGQALLLEGPPGRNLIGLGVPPNFPFVIEIGGVLDRESGSFTLTITPAEED